MNVSLACPIWTKKSPALGVIWQGRNVSSWQTCFSYSGQPWSLTTHRNSLIQTRNFNVHAALQKGNRVFSPLFSVRELKSKEHWTNVLRRESTSVLVPYLSSCTHSVTRRGARCGDTEQQSPGAAQSYTDCGVRSMVTLPISVHKQWSHRYPPGCPEEIHTQELYTNERALI